MKEQLLQLLADQRAVFEHELVHLDELVAFVESFPSDVTPTPAPVVEAAPVVSDVAPAPTPTEAGLAPVDPTPAV